MGSQNTDWLHTLKDAVLTQGNYNAVIVGWESGAENINYAQSASDTRSVGYEIGLVAARLISSGNSHRSRLYCVGHSLGAHVCGHAGMTTKIGRITGLDPAGPLFENRHWTAGLNPSSADLVDVIHTDGKSLTGYRLGMMKILGHVDFYPNGGAWQPSCILKTKPVDTKKANKGEFGRGLQLLVIYSNVHSLQVTRSK